MDIFTSDDDSFAVGDGENISFEVNTMRNYDIAVESVKPVSSGVQCDFSLEEEAAELTEGISDNMEDTSNQLED